MIERLQADTPYLDLLLECSNGHVSEHRVKLEGEIQTREINFEGEKVYAWIDDIVCDQCGIRVHIEIRTYTYPDDQIIYVGFEETRGAKVLNKELVYQKLGFKPAT